MAQELLTTFQDEYHLDRVTLIPSTKRPPFHPGGIFTVRAATVTASAPGRTGTILPDVPDAVVRVLWERKSDGGFPESKVLKQRVRDIVAPKQSLGHSDANAMIADGVLIPQLETKEQLETTCEDCPPNIGLPVASVPSASAIFLETDEREDPMEVEVEVEAAIQKNVEIVYCAKSQWLLRASWMAQELLLLNLDTATTTIPPLSAATDEREEHVPPQVHYTVALVPSRSPAPEGTFVSDSYVCCDVSVCDCVTVLPFLLSHLILSYPTIIGPAACVLERKFTLGQNKDGRTVSGSKGPPAYDTSRGSWGETPF